MTDPKAAPRLVAPAGEAARALIVKLVFVIFWLLIFEGVLRKWGIPSLHKFVFFIRDPFVLWIYVIAIRNGMWPTEPLFKTGFVLGILFLPIALLQSLTNEISPLVVIYGWKMYFWYLPLAFIIGKQVRGRELAKIFRYSLLVAIPMAVLVFLQFRAPPQALINQTPSGEATALLVSRGIARASGTFSVSVALSWFIGSTFAMALALWLMPRSQRPLSSRMLLVASLAVLTCLLLCGSRTAFYYVAVVVLAGIVSSLLVRGTKRRAKAILLPQIFALIGFVLFATIFSESFAAMKERQSLAAEAEGSPLVRVVGPITSTLNVLPGLSFLGRGIGFGSPGGAMLAQGKMAMFLSEDEWPRTLEEAGIAGVLYIAYRIVLAFALLAGAVEAARMRNNSMPLILWSFVGPLLLIGPITNQGTCNGYGWIFAGFCLAANKLGKPSSSRV